MLLSIPVGTTSKMIEFPVFDSSSTIGATLAGLVYNTASLTAYYNRQGASGAATAMSLATMTKGTWVTLGFVAVDGTNMPGWYQLGVPDAALAAGVTYVTIMLKGAANMVPVCIIIELTAVSNQDAVRGGMTALPNAVPGADGGVFIAGTNAATVITTSLTTHLIGTVDTVTTVTNQLTAAAVAAGVWRDAVSGDFTVTSSIGKSLYIDNVVPGGTNGHFIAGTNAATTVTTALTTTFTGNLTGSVASIATGGIAAGSFAAGAIDATAIADAAIDNATFAADVGSTAFATNIVALAVFKALDNAIGDAVSLTADGLLEKMRKLSWIIGNKIAVTDANGNTIIYKDNSSTAAFTVNAMLTDDLTTTTRLRAA